MEVIHSALRLAAADFLRTVYTVYDTRAHACVTALIPLRPGVRTIRGSKVQDRFDRTRDEHDTRKLQDVRTERTRGITKEGSDGV